MIETEVYEKLRLLLNTFSVLPLPRHEVTFKLLTNLFAKEETEITISGFDKVHEAIEFADISKRVNIPRNELMVKLDEMVSKGLIRKASPNAYMVVPFYPGIAMDYFVLAKAPLEKRRKVSEAADELSRLCWDQEMVDRKYSLYRVMPAVEPIERTIDINESIDVENRILPYEILREHIAKINPQLFMVVPCACRDSAELAGNHCQRTENNYCITLGTGAERYKEQGIGREVSLDELIEILEKAEKEGLVHMTTNIRETATILCNCCPCCCIYLRPFVKTGGGVGAITKSNFEPNRDRDLCQLCEYCSEICPTGAIFHHYSHLPDASDDYMRVRSELCIGCGICASNCPHDAITMQKTKNIEPSADFMEMAINSFQSKTH